MRSDHLSKHIKTHQKGTRLGLATSSTDVNLDDIILSAEADQSNLAGHPLGEWLYLHFSQLFVYNFQNRSTFLKDMLNRFDVVKNT